MSVSINLNMKDPLSPELDLVGNDELKEELGLFLTQGVGASINGFNKFFLSKFIFDSEFGHHRWDFVFKDECHTDDYGGNEWNGLTSLNLAWDCWLIAKDLRTH